MQSDTGTKGTEIPHRTYYSLFQSFRILSQFGCRFEMWPHLRDTLCGQFCVVLAPINFWPTLFQLKRKKMSCVVLDSMNELNFLKIYRNHSFGRKNRKWSTPNLPRGSKCGGGVRDSRMDAFRWKRARLVFELFPFNSTSSSPPHGPYLFYSILIGHACPYPLPPHHTPTKVVYHVGASFASVSRK